MMEDRYSLLRVSDKNISKIMIGDKTATTLEKIDNFLMDEKMYMHLIKDDHRLYIYDKYYHKVISPISKNANKELLHQLFANKQDNMKKDPMWQATFNAFLLKDIYGRSKSSIVHDLMNEKRNDSKYAEQEGFAYFYGDLDLKEVINLSYNELKTNVQDVKYSDTLDKFYIDNNDNNLNKAINASFAWFSKYQNIRNYLVLLEHKFDNQKMDKEQIVKDIKAIFQNIAKNKININKITRKLNIDKLEELENLIKQRKDKYIEDVITNTKDSELDATMDSLDYQKIDEEIREKANLQYEVFDLEIEANDVPYYEQISLEEIKKEIPKSKVKSLQREERNREILALAHELDEESNPKFDNYDLNYNKARNKCRR